MPPFACRTLCHHIGWGCAVLSEWGRPCGWEWQQWCQCCLQRHQIPDWVASPGLGRPSAMVLLWSHICKSCYQLAPPITVLYHPDSGLLHTTGIWCCVYYIVLTHCLHVWHCIGNSNELQCVISDTADWHHADDRTNSGKIQSYNQNIAPSHRWYLLLMFWWFKSDCRIPFLQAKSIALCPGHPPCWLSFSCFPFQPAWWIPGMSTTSIIIGSDLLQWCGGLKAGLSVVSLGLFPDTYSRWLSTSQIHLYVLLLVATSNRSYSWLQTHMYREYSLVVAPPRGYLEEGFVNPQVPARWGCCNPFWPFLDGPHQHLILKGLAVGSIKNSLLVWVL